MYNKYLKNVCLFFRVLAPLLMSTKLNKDLRIKLNQNFAPFCKPEGLYVCMYVLSITHVDLEHTTLYTVIKLYTIHCNAVVIYTYVYVKLYL